MAYTPALEDIPGDTEESSRSYTPSFEDVPEEESSNQSFGRKLVPNIVAGLAQMGHGLINTPSNFANYLASKNLIKPETAHKVPRQQDYDYAELLNLPKTATLSDKLIRGLAQYAPAILAPEAELGALGKGISSIPYAGRFLKKAIGNALPVGGFSATQSEDQPVESAAHGAAATLPFSALSTLATTMNPWARIAGRVGLGAAGAYGGYEGAKSLGADSLTAEIPAAVIGGTLGLMGRNPKTEARENMLKGVEGTPYQEKLEAANRLGLKYITPAEASGNPFVGAKQGAAGKTDEGSTLLYNEGQERLASEKKAIQSIKSSIGPVSSDASFAVRDAAKEYLDKLKKLRSKETTPFYKEAENLEIPQHELDSLLENPRIKKTYSDILHDPDYQIHLQGKQPTGKKMIAMVENRIDNLINLAEKKPYNQERIDNLKFARKNVKDNYHDSRVQHVLDEIYKNDPVFHATASAINPRSIKLLDLVKKKIDSESENIGSKLNASGRDKFKSGLIGNASEKIRKVADQYVEPYTKARNIHEDMTPTVQEAEKSSIGKIANTKDINLKNISKMIFDPSQTNLHVLSKLKNSIMRENPKAWNGIVRNEMDRLTNKGNITGNSFYKKVLENPGLYGQFTLALNHNPKALQKLEDAKLVFGDLISPPSVRTASALSKTAMDQNRNALKHFADSIKEKFTTRQYDKAAIELITNPKWVDELHKVEGISNFRKRAGKFIDLMGRVTGSSVSHDNKTTNEGNE